MDLYDVTLQSTDMELLVQVHQGLLSRLWTSIAQLCPDQINILHSGNMNKDLATRLLELQRRFVAAQDAVDGCFRLKSLANGACWRQRAVALPLVANRLTLLRGILFELYKQMRDMPLGVFGEFSFYVSMCSTNFIRR